MDVLFAADVRQIPISEALEAEAKRAVSEPARAASWLYAREIVDGVLDHQVEIDELIETYSQHWTLTRMPAVDRAVLRIAVWEMLYNPDVPVNVAIDEAVESVKTLSTDDSPGFVNGLLATIALTAAE
jgi:N utilization substance protein B